MVESTVGIDLSVPARVKREFEEKRNFYLGIGEAPDKANADAINQALNPLGLDRVGVKSSELTRDVSRKIAQALIDASPLHMQQIVELFTRGGDLVARYNLSDPRTQRIVAAAKHLLNGK